jgi:hypothetical protein
MTSEQFTYWLQGFLEVSGQTVITAEQTQIIKDHLNLVFEKKTIDRTKLVERAAQYGTGGVTTGLGDMKAYC